MTDNLDGKRAELVIFAVGEGLRRSNHDTLARMDAQRVEVFHVADRDTIVIAVAHHLIFYFLPTFQTLLHQDLGREREGLFGKFVEFFLVVGKT